MSLWGLIQQAPEPETSALLEEFAAVFPTVELRLINPEIAEQLVWIELIVLTTLNRREERDLVARGPAAAYVTGEQVAKAVAALLAT